MHIVSAKSLRALRAAQGELTDLREKHTRLAKRYRELERAHQEVLLQLGLRGLATEQRPAQPARLVLKKIRR